MMHNIKDVSASFSTNKPHNLEEARELYIKVVDELIDTFNNDPTAQPYLHNTPFNVTNTSVIFLFFNKNDTPTEGINHIVPYYESDLIRYYITDQLTDKRVKVHEETYDEAKAILAKQHKETKNT